MIPDRLRTSSKYKFDSFRFVFPLNLMAKKSSNMNVCMGLMRLFTQFEEK